MRKHHTCTKMNRSLSQPLCRSRLACFAVLSIGLLPSIAEAEPAEVAGKITINAWEYDRGNTRVSENTGLYGDYRDKHPELMLTGGDKLPWSVEYDVDFPVDATYSLRVRYASAGVRPLEVWIDDQRVGECCLKKTNNSPPYMDRHPNVWEGLTLPDDSGTQTSLSGLWSERPLALLFIRHLG